MTEDDFAPHSTTTVELSKQGIDPNSIQNSRHMSGFGEVWQVYDSSTNRTGWALLHWGGSDDTNADSSILSVINWTGEPPTKEYWSDKVQKAYEIRETFINLQTNTGYRLINGVGDFIPGLICDIFGSVAVIVTDDVQNECFLAVKEFLMEKLQISHIMIQDSQNRPFLCSANSVFPEANPIFKIMKPSGNWVVGGVESCYFLENGVQTYWNPALCEATHTGHYFAHRTARQLIAALSKGKKVLDLFAYTGTMGLAALKAGAQMVTFIESDPASCKIIEKNIEHAVGRNWAEHCNIEQMRVQALSEKGRYDIVICDPPDITPHTLAPQDTRTKSGDKRVHFYQHMCTIAVNRCEYGGYIFFFLNTRNISRQMLLRVVQSTASRTGSTLRVVRHIGNSPDFPTSAAAKSGSYFGVVLQKISSKK
eukprot:TRINITY_DN16514_c0_g1_i2.p1 TRINITY_DN16514_c0_g1~~TRINITY_DN16514_c0_g1_i2.p1  ORF type:complete len:423 (+),score=53.33 TRINITY_DN16514_c0_g1_i2:253-1521(+)